MDLKIHSKEEEEFLKRVIEYLIFLIEFSKKFPASDEDNELVNESIILGMQSAASQLTFSLPKKDQERYKISLDVLAQFRVVNQLQKKQSHGSKKGSSSDKRYPGG